MQSIHNNRSQNTTQLITIAIRNMCAILVRDSAELVDACDEGADEEEVDEPDELGVGF